MIVLNLVCSAGHRFEGWFASVQAFDDQAERQLVSCPHCNAFGIQRLPSPPHVVKASSAALATDESDAAMVMFVEQLRQIASNSEDVGDRFSQEARRIHYHEVPERRIRGLATLDETRELLDEGIMVLPVPPKRDIH